MYVFNCTDPKPEQQKLIRMGLAYIITTEPQKNHNLKHSFYFF